MAGSKMSFIGQKLQAKGVLPPAGPADTSTPGDTQDVNTIDSLGQKIDDLTTMVQTMQDRMDQYWPDQGGNAGGSANDGNMGMGQ